MTRTGTDLRIKPFARTHAEACLTLFDRNCPQAFAPNERADYEAFLDSADNRYSVCVIDDRIVGAFGLTLHQPTHRARLVWIMLDPEAQGLGAGRAIMTEAQARAVAGGATLVDIAASQVSAPFFARFGARQILLTPDGWGPSMHRIDMEWPVSPAPN